MEQSIEVLIIISIVAVATAFLAKRFVFKGKQNGCSAACKCGKPEASNRSR